MSVLVVSEQAGGAWHGMSFETIAAGAEAAAALGCPLQVAVLGSGVAGLAAEAAAKRVSEVVVIDDPALAAYTPDGFAAAVGQAVEQLNPTLVLFPHTYQVRDFAPKLTAGLGKAFLSDAVGIAVDDGKLVFVRRLFQGKLNADVMPVGDAPYFASIQSGVFRADALPDGGAPAPVRNLDVVIDPAQIRTRPEAPFQEAKGAVDLTAAEIIVSVGRGHQRSGEHSARRRVGAGARGRVGRLAADLRQRLAAARAPGRQLRPDRLAEPLPCAGHLRRHPARRRHERRKNHRRHQ